MPGDKTKDGEGSSGGITYDSPYYLHPSDYPKQLHVNKVLTDNNFVDWSQEMTNFLFAKNKIEFVDGTIKKPEKGSKDYMPWMRVDDMIKGWLTTAMEKNIRNSVKYAGTASEIWSDLNERFGKESALGRCFKLIGYPDWWPGKKGEKSKGKAACVETEMSPIPGLRNEDYQLFLKNFSGTGNAEGVKHVANMAYKESEEGALEEELDWYGEMPRGLYKMNMIQKRKAMATTIETWHKKLGHASKGKLARVYFLKTSINNLDNFCDSCAKAKHTILPFPSSSIKTNASFELIHCDIWGGYRIPSYTRANYFLTIVDDFSRAIWIFLLKYKSEASQHLKNFHRMIKVQFEKGIKRIRCDNGGEFTSTKMLEFYNENGILLETTCPHTPQQNRVVERKHRHLLETARALRISANLPKRFWGECILTAAYVINRLPSKVIKNKTPFEIIWNKEPDYSLLKVFGCLVYFKNTNTKGDKFEDRGKPGVFLGYPPGTKGYKIFDLETRKIILSRNVNFHEEIFPFKNVQDSGENEAGEPMVHHECHCYNEQDLTQNKRQNFMEENTQVHHDQDSELNNPHEAQVEHQMGQIDDEEQPNNEEFETNKPNKGAEAQSEARPTRTKVQPSKFKDFMVQVPPSVKHLASTSNQVTSTAPVLIPNGDSIPVKGKGDCILPGGTKVNGVYISDFKCNLLSVNRLCRDLQCFISFFPNFCVIQGLQKRNLIGTGRCQGGLYKMKMIQERKAMATTIETWHKRLGHASKGKLARVDFLETSINNLDNFCDSCAKAKHTRLPFPSSSIKTNASFKLIHCDIWGGYRIPSYTRANYFLTIVDDFSRAIWIFLLKHKNEASQHLKNFHRKIDVQFEKGIKRIRCDNGGEFTSTKMLEFYNENGILLETTCLHTPQQNGVVERKHRHLLETARALRISANLPKRF
nr:putative ribonuclease H-like domain-containing protein [Tanacetum cinerariifolium]